LFVIWIGDHSVISLLFENDMIMNALNKTKKELLKQLQELQKEHDLLKTSNKKDISKRKRVEEKFKMLSSVVGQSTEGMAIADLDGNLIFTNEAWGRMHGYKSPKELLGKNLAISHNQEQLEKDVKPFNEKVIEHGAYSGEVGHITRDGKPFPTLMATTLLKDKKGKPYALAGIAKDITGSKRAEEALLERDTRFNKLSSHVPGMIYQFMKKPDGTYCVPFTTEAIRNIFGCSPQAVRNDFSPIARMILAEDLDNVVGSIEYSAKNLTTWQCEYRVQIPGQPVRWMFGQSTPEKLADGSIIWHGFNTDVTGRKQAEMLLHKLNRTYALLSEINQMIVRVHKPQELFEAACTVAVSKGGFRMAWIGLLDAQTKQVTPVAYTGETGNYLERLNITMDESIRGHGPTATALHTGKHIVANDIVSDPRMTPWRDDALRLGYRASAVFPFNIAGEMRGVLTLYAPEVNFFDNEELKLLDEMAADIAFAVKFFEEEEQRKRAEETLRESEENFRSIFENNSAAMALIEPDTSISMVNDEYCKASGYTKQEVIGMNWTQQIPPEDLERLKEYNSSFAVKE
jgi:PAS domain S-box-containing protein